MKKLLLLSTFTASLFACQPTNKPTFDLAKAKMEIEAANKNIIKDISSGDSVSAANDYSQDGKLMLTNAPSITEKDKIAAFWGGFSKIGGDITLTTLEVWGDENYVTEEGVFEIKAKDGKQLDKGKYIVIWKEEDGKWKLHRDISNTDLPLAK